jgi:hypothetical protein
VLQAFSEESYPDSAGRETRLRDQLVFNVEVSEFHDMQISLDPTVENAVKTSAPGRVVRYVINITNNGNVPDVPSLNNHTATRDGNALLWAELPGMGALDGWSVEWKMLKQIGVDVATEEECLREISTASAFPEDQCVYLTDINEFRLPEMDPYTTYTVVAIITIATTATLDTRHIGLKVYSRFGDMSEDGDFDDSPAWEGEDLDNNELILTLRLRAPNLVIASVSVSDYSGDVDSTIPIQIVLQNTGNVHATDIEIVLCEYDESSSAIQREISKNGCAEENIVMRQVVGALLAPDDSEDAKEITLFLLYPVTAGSHGVYVVVDPMNEIVESNEGDNVERVGKDLSSSNPFMDVAGDVVSKTALPFMVILLTFALLGVVYLVGKGRRDEVNKRIAEQSSLITVLSDDDL